MLIGRKKEQALLEKVFFSKESEFITLYGRIRVGKTFLIREYFSNRRCLYFQATGLQNGKLHQQLENFTKSLSACFFENIPLETPNSWTKAFELLHKQILSKNKNQKIVIFLDELPWMATRKSSLMQVIDYYWNHHWSSLKNIILVLCGSSASWLIQKILFNKGGLHNRTTVEIKLLPFTLSETKEFLISRDIDINNQHILDIYLSLGGIPYYLKYITKGLSA